MIAYIRIVVVCRWCGKQIIQFEHLDECETCARARGYVEYALRTGLLDKIFPALHQGQISLEPEKPHA